MSVDIECGHDHDGTDGPYSADVHYTDRKFHLMQSFCGGGGTARLFFGDEQIARVDSSQLRQLAAEILHLDEKSKTLIEDMERILSEMPKDQAQDAIASRIMQDFPTE